MKFGKIVVVYFGMQNQKIVQFAKKEFFNIQL